MKQLLSTSYVPWRHQEKELTFLFHSHFSQRLLFDPFKQITKTERGWYWTWTPLSHFIFTSRHPNIDLLFSRARPFVHDSSSSESWGPSPWLRMSTYMLIHTLPVLYGQVNSQVLFIFSWPLSPPSSLSPPNSLYSRHRYNLSHFFKTSYVETVMGRMLYFVPFTVLCTYSVLNKNLTEWLIVNQSP